MLAAMQKAAALTGGSYARRARAKRRRLTKARAKKRRARMVYGGSFKAWRRRFAAVAGANKAQSGRARA